MTLQEYNPTIKFEQDFAHDPQELKPSPERMSAICLSLADICMRYAGVERIPRYHEQHRENDAEHSVMVVALSLELANELRPDLDKGLLAQYGMFHDLIEIIVGDTPTYNLSEQQLTDKHEREQCALEELVRILPPYIAKLVIEYEAQLTPESRFTRAVDKLSPVLVDILGPGEMVMRDDYGVTTVVELLRNQQKLNDSMRRRFGEDTPEIVDIYEQLGNIYTANFQVG